MATTQKAGVAHLGIAEKGFDKSEVEIKEIDLIKAENFERKYLKMNPNGTVPTLTAPHLSQPLIDTQPILEFLDQSRPSVKGHDLIPSNAQEKAVANALTKLVHSSDLDTGLVVFGCLNDADIDRLNSTPWFTYLDTRQSTLENCLSVDSTNAFYVATSKENGSLLRIFTNAPNADREAFFKDTAARYKKFGAGLEELEHQIRLLTLSEIT